MKKEIWDVACNWLSLAVPMITPIRETVKGVNSISESILCEKLYYIMANQDANFDEWLKLSEKFEGNNKAYQKMVKQIIYTINAINEAEMLSAYGYGNFSKHGRR